MKTDTDTLPERNAAFAINRFCAWIFCGRSSSRILRVVGTKLASRRFGLAGRRLRLSAIDLCRRSNSAGTQFKRHDHIPYVAARTGGATWHYGNVRRSHSGSVADRREEILSCRRVRLPFAGRIGIWSQQVDIPLPVRRRRADKGGKRRNPKGRASICARNVNRNSALILQYQKQETNVPLLAGHFARIEGTYA